MKLSTSPRSKAVAVVIGVVISTGVVAAAPSAQAVQGGSATCDALDVALSASLGGITIVDLSGGTDDVTAPATNGTNTGGGSVTVGGGDTSVSVEVLSCNATRAAGFLSADAEIASGAVTILGETVATFGVITSEVLCPAQGTGSPTASSSGAVTVGGTLISLSSGADLTGSATVPFSAPGVDGTITVEASTSAVADADSAAATGLSLVLSFSGVVAEQSVALDLGTIVLAETSCTVGLPDAPGTTAPGTTAPGTTAPGTTAPGTTAPGTTAPGTTAPGTTAPGTTAPGTTAPGTTAPAGELPATR